MLGMLMLRTAGAWHHAEVDLLLPWSTAALQLSNLEALHWGVES